MIHNNRLHVELQGLCDLTRRRNTYNLLREQERNDIFSKAEDKR